MLLKACLALLRRLPTHSCAAPLQLGMMCDAYAADSCTSGQNGFPDCFLKIISTEWEEVRRHPVAAAVPVPGGAAGALRRRAAATVCMDALLLCAAPVSQCLLPSCFFDRNTLSVRSPPLPPCSCTPTTTLSTQPGVSETKWRSSSESPGWLLLVVPAPPGLTVSQSLPAWPCLGRLTPHRLPCPARLPWPALCCCPAAAMWRWTRWLTWSGGRVSWPA